VFRCWFACGCWQHYHVHDRQVCAVTLAVILCFPPGDDGVPVGDMGVTCSWGDTANNRVSARPDRVYLQAQLKAVDARVSAIRTRKDKLDKRMKALSKGVERYTAAVGALKAAKAGRATGDLEEAAVGTAPAAASPAAEGAAGAAIGAAPQNALQSTDGVAALQVPILQPKDLPPISDVTLNGNGKTPDADGTSSSKVAGAPEREPGTQPADEAARQAAARFYSSMPEDSFSATADNATPISEDEARQAATRIYSSMPDETFTLGSADLATAGEVPEFGDQFTAGLPVPPAPAAPAGGVMSVNGSTAGNGTNPYSAFRILRQPSAASSVLAPTQDSPAKETALATPMAGPSAAVNALNSTVQSLISAAEDALARAPQQDAIGVGPAGVPPGVEAGPDATLLAKEYLDELQAAADALEMEADVRSEELAQVAAARGVNPEDELKAVDRDVAASFATAAIGAALRGREGGVPIEAALSMQPPEATA